MGINGAGKYIRWIMPLIAAAAIVWGAAKLDGRVDAYGKRVDALEQGFVSFQARTREDICANTDAIRLLERQSSTINGKLDMLLEHFGIEGQQ